MEKKNVYNTHSEYWFTFRISHLFIFYVTVLQLLLLTRLTYLCTWINFTKFKQINDEEEKEEINIPKENREKSHFVVTLKTIFGSK